MALNDIRLNEEMFRLLYEEGDAYSKQQLAEILGRTDHNFDKFYTKFKEVFAEQDSSYLEQTQQSTSYFHRLKYDAYQFNKNILITFYRMHNFTNDIELDRTCDIIRCLSECGGLSMRKIIEYNEAQFWGNDPDQVDPESRKTSYRRSLKMLTENGVLEKKGSKYFLTHNIVDDLTDDELLDLFSFVHFASNTDFLSVPGYLLVDYLTMYIKENIFPNVDLEVFLYKFINYIRILDEHKSFELMKMIREERYVSFRYYTKKQKQKAHAKNKTPQKPRERLVLPLRLVYEHQYGRWYLIGKECDNLNHSVYKLQGITEIKAGSKVDPLTFEQEKIKTQTRLKNSWLVSDDPTVEVKLKFYFDQSRPDATINFIEQRVQREQQWGNIIENNEDHFIYSIAVNGIKEIKPWILSFGSSVEVLEPLSLREEIKREWELLLEEYDQDV